LNEFVSIEYDFGVIAAVMLDCILASVMGSNQSQQQRQRALSDFPSPSSSVGNGQQQQSPSHYNRILRPPLSLECAGLSTVSLDQQTYRHVVQDVTVMKTLLLRLKRALQETETSNPFESSLNLKNGLSKSALFEVEMQKNDERLMQLTKDDLGEENAALRTQIAVMRQQLEEQNRIIQCLQHQLKHVRQRSFRKTESVGEHSLVKDVDDRKERATTVEPSGNNGTINTVSSDV